MMRLDKFLSECKVLSRAECNKAVKAGRVMVNGFACSKKEQKINESSDLVFVDGKRIVYKPFVYLMLNKPIGYVSATNDLKEKTVLDLVDEHFNSFNLFPVGRLDKNTTGLVILTNDGEMAHRVLAPKNNHKKKYEFECKFALSDECKQKIESGIEVDQGVVCKPCEIKLINGTSGEIVLTEGKYHEIKRMFEAVKNKITKLRRVEFAGIKLGDLAEGQFRELNSDEIKLLFIK